jgi:hypothetical protein
MRSQRRSGNGVVGRVAGRLLAGALLGSMTSCTINEVVLYKTSNYPAVQITPSAKIGPS